MSLILPSGEERNRAITLVCIFVLTSVLGKLKTWKECWLGPLTLKALLSLLELLWSEAAELICIIHIFHPHFSQLQYLV